MPFHDDLIRLYAEHPLDGLEHVQELQDLCAAHQDDFAFRDELNNIKEAKSFVETFIDLPAPPLTTQQKVAAAIRLLVSLRGENDRTNRDLCYALIKAGYFPKWNPAQQAYFEDAWIKIQAEYDFFLSFTCRRPAVAGDNPINTNYREFIISEIGLDEYNSADRKNSNLLALALHRILAEKATQAFFFPHKQQDNSVTVAKLEQACDSTLVFVQLVQRLMFTRPAHAGQPNYCFFEWSRVEKRLRGPDRERRILFVVADESPQRFGQMAFHPTYMKWHAHVCQKDPPYLPEVRQPDLATVQAIGARLRDKLLPFIEDAWSDLSAKAPM